MLVLGLGTFGGGLGAARWLAGQGAEVLVTDRAGPERFGPAVAELSGLGVRLVLGGHEGVDFARADLLVVNPAIPLDAPPVLAARAAGVRLTTEIELLLERWEGPVVGVTGSNGKSTTVSLTHALLDAAGVPAVAGGNVGGSLLGDLARGTAGRVAVLELSSFMLDLLALGNEGPDVAVLLNITPNHLDRHGSFEAYGRAKARILRRASSAVLYADDPAVRDAARGFSGRTLWYGRRGELTVDEAGRLGDRDGAPLAPGVELPLAGRAQRCDLAAALLAAGAVSGEPERVIAALPAALATWRCLPHRCELVAVRDGVRWVDDSVSTTPESSAASLGTQPGPCLLIAGGRDKGLQPDALLRAAAGNRVRVVLTVGEAGPGLSRCLSAAGIAAEQVGTIAAAVRRAAALASRGDTVLLSPGYASYDQFADYRERGRRFAREVGRVVPGPTRTLSERGTEC